MCQGINRPDIAQICVELWTKLAHSNHLDSQNLAKAWKTWNYKKNEWVWSEQFFQTSSQQELNNSMVEISCSSIKQTLYRQTLYYILTIYNLKNLFQLKNCNYNNIVAKFCQTGITHLYLCPLHYPIVNPYLAISQLFTLTPRLGINPIPLCGTLEL